MASKRRVLGSLAVVCQRMSDEVVQCFVEDCLTDPFHRQSVDSDVDDDNIQLCEAVFSGVGEVAQLPRDCLSATVFSLLTGSTLTTVYQLLPLPRQVCPIVVCPSFICNCDVGCMAWYDDHSSGPVWIFVVVEA